MSEYSRIKRGRMCSDQFTQISNRLFRDPRLSYKAKGIFGLISTHRDGYGITPETIAETGLEGVSAIKTALRELEECGYLERRRDRNPDGTLGGSTYYITDDPSQTSRSEPEVDYPPVDQPPVDEPTVADRSYKNTSRKNTSRKNTRVTAPPADADATATHDTLPIDVTEAPSLVQLGVGLYIDTVKASGGVVSTGVRLAVGASVKRLVADPEVDNNLIPDAVRRAAQSRSRAIEQFLGAPRTHTYNRGTHGMPRVGSGERERWESKSRFGLPA